MANPGYSEYIAGPIWAAKRKEFIASGEAKACHWCERPWAKGFHVHHATYERFGGEELMSDLRAMCRICHRILHRARIEEGKLTPLDVLTDKYAKNARPKDTPRTIAHLWLHHAMAGRKRELRAERKAKAEKADRRKTKKSA